MYEFLKKILLTLFPKRILIALEFPVRKIYSLAYRGTAVTCPVCDNSFKNFQKINTGDTLCVRCGSIPRQRLLWIYLTKQNLLKSSLKTLHFSPNVFFANTLKKRLFDHYKTTDFEIDSKTDLHLDITKIDQPDNSFDTIICYHVLEHIVDDNAAMAELYRILSPLGRLIVQVPFNNINETFEDFTITSPEGRLNAFGQEDHVRIYGLNNFLSRLTNAKFEVNLLKSSEIASMEEIKINGLNAKELVIICYKE